ncbi:MAG: LytR C-terminal domain-containing protein [Desulfobacterales bacterium]|uniref:LytR C-terminal domain-containing protein n=1 Tax=Candidatus Desulfatibia profunda TaxID=2841695 RepID=A0A8J6NRR1_9BACT|nr:LytR C-terminal domain-containing protein [Candidatus Desulfatibia profunda]MBL7180085.1 LytR C-terminal domain-containing protein [Desulfobacterales bacterium]
MFRNVLVIIVLSLGFSFYGCSFLKPADGGSKKDAAGLDMSKDEMKNEIQKLKTENDELKRQIDAAEEINQSVRAENAKKLIIVSEHNRVLNQELDKLKEDNRRIAAENETLKERLAGIRVKAETSAPLPPKAAKSAGRLKIKVLSGDGDLNSAKMVAKKLRKVGYTIKSIDYAPRSNFQTTTIYFAAKFEVQAKRIGSDLDRNPVLKPLNWPSEFDLIVVAGPPR